MLYMYLKAVLFQQFHDVEKAVTPLTIMHTMKLHTDFPNIPDPASNFSENTLFDSFYIQLQEIH